MSLWKLASLSGLPGLCVEYPWTLFRLSTKSMDIVQGDNGECPLSQQTLSSLSGLPRLCPEYPQTLSRLSTDFYGQCPGSPSKLSNEHMDSVDI